MCVHFGMWNLDSSIRRFDVTRRHFNFLRIRHLQENTQIVAHQVSLSVNSKIKNQIHSHTRTIWLTYLKWYFLYLFIFFVRSKVFFINCVIVGTWK